MFVRATTSNQVRRFEDYSTPHRKNLQETVMELAGEGRLYLRRQDNSLGRAEPMHVKEHLDSGLPVEVVTAVGREDLDWQGSMSAHSQRSQGLFSPGWDKAELGISRGTCVKIFYTSSPVRDWDGLGYIAPGPGIQGVAVLPPSGCAVEVQSQFEREWSARSWEQSGFFLVEQKNSNRSGSSSFERRSPQGEL